MEWFLLKLRTHSSIFAWLYRNAPVGTRLNKKQIYFQRKNNQIFFIWWLQLDWHEQPLRRRFTLNLSFISNGGKNVLLVSVKFCVFLLTKLYDKLRFSKIRGWFGDESQRFSPFPRSAHAMHVWMVVNGRWGMKSLVHFYCQLSIHFYQMTDQCRKI